jgi:hypothetical protein
MIDPTQEVAEQRAGVASLPRERDGAPLLSE